MNYSEMSDAEINMIVANLVGYFTDEPRALDDRLFDPCNSWADAGPIIAQNYISLIPLKKDG